MTFLSVSFNPVRLTQRDHWLVSVGSDPALVDAQTVITVEYDYDGTGYGAPITVYTGSAFQSGFTGPGSRYVPGHVAGYAFGDSPWLYQIHPDPAGADRKVRINIHVENGSDPAVDFTQEFTVELACFPSANTPLVAQAIDFFPYPDESTGGTTISCEFLKLDTIPFDLSTLNLSLRFLPSNTTQAVFVGGVAQTGYSGSTTSVQAWGVRVTIVSDTPLVDLGLGTTCEVVGYVSDVAAGAQNSVEFLASEGEGGASWPIFLETPPVTQWTVTTPLDAATNVPRTTTIEAHLTYVEATIDTTRFELVVTVDGTPETARNNGDSVFLPPYDTSSAINVIDDNNVDVVLVRDTALPGNVVVSPTFKYFES